MPTRRRFLKSSAVASATALAAPAIVRAAASPSGRLRVAVVGMGGRGARSHVPALRQLEKTENVEIAAVSDADAARMNAAADDCQKASGTRPATAQDMRRLLDDKAIDAVALATPNHWHALETIWCCQAGKDVYCEKPGSHDIFEGRQMVKAARKYNRIVQHGTQCRTSPNIREGVQKLRDGAIGRVYMARAIAYKVKAGGKNQFGPTPPDMDWDLWLGPAPQKPYNKLAITRWRFLRDYGNGQTGDQGVHQLDIVRWGLGINTHPSQIQALGAVNLFHPGSDEDTPTNLMAAYRFAGSDALVSFETRDGYTNEEAGMGVQYPFVDHKNVVGVIFFGEDGYMIMPDYSSYYTFLGANRKPGPSASVEGAPFMDTEHFQNWIRAVRSRNYRDLTADIEEGHLSSALCHLANIAFWTGRTLEFDPSTERFSHDDEANRLIKPAYRAPYAVPEEI